MRNATYVAGGTAGPGRGAFRGAHRETRPPRYGRAREAGEPARRRPINASTYNRPFTLFVRRVPGWKIALIIAAVLAVVAALAIVAGAVFLLILPVILVVGLAHRLFGPRMPAAARGWRGGARVIEGDYVSVPDERDLPRRGGR